MAGDRRSVLSGCHGGEVRKVHRRDDSALIGIAGDAALASGFARWFLEGENGTRASLIGNDDNYALALIVRPCGRIEEHSRWGWSTLESDFVAYGSGLEAALAAMHMGADARRAVEIACSVVNDCGGGIDVVRANAAPGDRE